MEKETAAKILAAAMDCSRNVDQSVASIMGACDNDEFNAYRRHAGAIMAELFEAIMAPIYDEYPDMAPDWYNEMNEKMRERQSKK